MKIVINDRIGGFRLSNEAKRKLYHLGSEIITATPAKNYYDSDDWEDELKEALEIPEHRAFSICYEDGMILSSYRVDEFRTSPMLVAVVEELGEAADSWSSKLRIIEIPDDVEYYIHDEHGYESVHEVHRVWR